MRTAVLSLSVAAGLFTSLMQACDGEVAAVSDAGDGADGPFAPAPAPSSGANDGGDGGRVVVTDANLPVKPTDARTDVYDTGSTARACDSFPEMVCNFDHPEAGGVCPPLAGIGAGMSGRPAYEADAGPDGSTAFAAVVSAGGLASFGMPFYTVPPEGPIPTLPGCSVTCEAHVRMAEGQDASVSVVMGDDFTWLLTSNGDAGGGAGAGSFVHTSKEGSSALSAPVSNEWMKVKILMAPSGALATSHVTVMVGDASTTSSVPVSKVGNNMRFGALTQSTMPVKVYVDDVVCQIHE